MSNLSSAVVLGSDSVIESISGLGLESAGL